MRDGSRWPIVPCQGSVQISVYSRMSERIAPADRRAEPALGRQPRAAASLGAPIRPARSRPLARRPPPLFARRSRAGARSCSRTWQKGSLPPRRPPQPCGRPRTSPSTGTGSRAVRDASTSSRPRSRGSTSLERRRSSTGCSPRQHSMSFLSEIVMPYLRDLGDRWERGEVTVAQEHFASSVLRGRLLGLARGWGRGIGPRALLACAPGEQHDLGLIAFGLALRAHGWRIEYLGADTPLDDDRRASLTLSSVDLVVVSAVAPERIGSAWHGAAGNLARQAARGRRRRSRRHGQRPHSMRWR